MSPHAASIPQPGEAAQGATAEPQQPRNPFVSVNWHFSRVCNYACTFCYHVSPSMQRGRAAHVSIEDGCKAIALLAEAGMRKLNFSGGEPFLFPKALAAWCRFAKGLNVYVSIITNGSKVTRAWLAENAAFVNMVGVSVDSCDEEVHRETGRGDRASARSHIGCALQVASWCHELGIPLKINTVVTQQNVGDDMHELIEAQLRPARWKVFQCLVIGGENSGGADARDATSVAVTAEAFQAYVDRHSDVACMVVEDNGTMRNSYVILNETLRFLNNGNGRKEASRSSILDVGVAKAFEDVTFDAESFQKRGGAFFETSDMEDLVA